MSKNILHLVDTLGLGGAQTILKALFEHKPQHLNWHIYALRQRDITIAIDHPNINIDPSSAKYSLAPIKAIKKLIEQHQIDTLHCHLFKASVIGYLIKRLYYPHLKLIIHEHGQIVGSDTGSKVLDYVYDNFNALAAAKTDLFIAVSMAMKNLLIEKASINEEKVNTLYNFVDLSKFRNTFSTADTLAYRASLGIAPDDFVIGFAGRLIPRKGWRSYLEAAKLIHDNDPLGKFKFLLAGDGADKAAINQFIAEYNLTDTVFPLGYVKTMPLFYASLNCFVMPSHFEGLPMSQLEVMALGIPLISTAGPGMDEIPKDGIDALFVQMRAPHDIAEKIMHLHAHPNLAQQLCNNAQKTVQSHNLDNYILQLEQLYAVL